MDSPFCVSSDENIKSNKTVFLFVITSQIVE